jgi:hypothetical protein
MKYFRGCTFTLDGQSSGALYKGLEEFSVNGRVAVIPPVTAVFHYKIVYHLNPPSADRLLLIIFKM